jgi:hypothetical protein
MTVDVWQDGRVKRKQLAMSEAIDAFEQEVGTLAMDIVRAVLQDEIAQRLAAMPVVDDGDDGDDAGDADEPAPAAEAARAAAPAPGKRVAWTRESVIEELATWLLTSPSVEASFIARHGRRGLVGNAKKIFGRFDAALNAANLHIARIYPEGPPSRQTLPATRG